MCMPLGPRWRGSPGRPKSIYSAAYIEKEFLDKPTKLADGEEYMLDDDEESTCVMTVGVSKGMFSGFTYKRYKITESGNRRSLKPRAADYAAFANYLKKTVV